MLGLRMAFELDQLRHSNESFFYKTVYTKDTLSSNVKKIFRLFYCFLVFENYQLGINKACKTSSFLSTRL